jgi:hypothetical protein
MLRVSLFGLVLSACCGQATLSTNHSALSRARGPADLLRRTFADVLVCPKCDGSMRLIATIEERDVIVKILRHLELPTEPLPIAPARDPPQLMLNQHYNEGDLDSWGN